MAAPQLYLVTPPAPDPASFDDDLRAVLDAAPFACVLLLPGDRDDDALRAIVDALRPEVQDRDIAFLIDGRPELAVATGCDGVHTCPAGPTYEHCRRQVGPDAIVGYSCRNDRHNAMVAAEQGADYIVFGEGNPTATDTALTIDLIGWWAELMEVPCVALDRIGPDSASGFAEAGADFLAIGPALWRDPAGPAPTAQAIAKAVGLI
ncbi:MAG: thiamine phosphate synthase [Pseudomonadota bacterium]